MGSQPKLVPLCQWVAPSSTLAGCYSPEDSRSVSKQSHVPRERETTKAIQKGNVRGDICLERIVSKTIPRKGSASYERIILALAGSKLRSFITSLAPLGLPRSVSSLLSFLQTPFLWVTPPQVPDGNQHLLLGSLLALHVPPS